MAGTTTPLYVVCSPCRCVGKTLVSRLLTEFHILDDRPVAAFDLADEGPQLADYLPQVTSIVEIGDILGQIAFFEQLIADNDSARIIDLSHRVFNNFFTVAEEIDFFEEAHRRSIEPLILFIVDRDPKSPEAYASLRRRFTAASLLPVRNRTETSAIWDCDVAPNAGTALASLEVPLLGFARRARIDQPAFSFCELSRRRPVSLPGASDDELWDWVKGIFSQFRMLELALGYKNTSPQITSAELRRRHTAQGRSPQDARPLVDNSRMAVSSGSLRQYASDVPYEVLKFAPKKMRRDGVEMDQFGTAIVEMLQSARRQLEDRINELETQIAHTQHRAVRAEMLLQQLEREIEEKLVEPAAAARSKIDELSPCVAVSSHGSDYSAVSSCARATYHSVPYSTRRREIGRSREESGENDVIKQLSQHDLVRLMEIKEQMLALLRETEFLLDGSSEWNRAKGYWLPHIRTALDNDHSYLGGSMFTMQDTIDALGKEIVG
jgi:hypothetical protein